MEKSDLISSIVLAFFMGALTIPLIKLMTESIKENREIDKVIKAKLDEEK